MINTFLEELGILPPEELRLRFSKRLADETLLFFGHVYTKKSDGSLLLAESFIAFNEDELLDKVNGRFDLSIDRMLLEVGFNTNNYIIVKPPKY